MLPDTSSFLREDFKVSEQPSITFCLNTEHGIIAGYVDGIAAVKQAIYLALATERYKHVIFSRNYGAELKDLLGQPMTFVIPEIQRRITEALLHDSRIVNVDEFDFKIEKGTVTVYFSIETIYGEVPYEKAVAV